MVLLYAGSVGLTFLVGAMLARLLGAAGYGVYALAMTTAAIAGLVTEFGLPVLALREAGSARASGDWGPLRGLLHWSDRMILGLTTVLAVATYSGLALFAKAQSSAYLATLLWAVALVPFVAIGRLRSFVLLALDHTLASQFPVMILRPGLFLLGCLALWWVLADLTPQAAMAAQVAGAAIAMIVLFVFFRRNQPVAMRIGVPQYTVRSWLGACVPMGLTEGLRVLQGQLALLLTGALAGTAQAGVYRVADAVVAVTALLSSVAGTVATPMFARLWQEGDSAGTERLAVLAAWIMLVGALVLGLPLALFGDWLFPLIFGTEFDASVPVFILLWLGSLLGASCGLVLALANMTGQHRLATRSFIVIALVNLLLGWLLVPQLGALGAAVASASGYFAGVVFCSWQLKRRTGLNCTLFNPAAFALVHEGFVAAWARMQKLEEGRRRP
jgi:O-antigen/teichoic acid export membrane protein